MTPGLKKILIGGGILIMVWGMILLTLRYRALSERNEQIRKDMQKQLDMFEEMGLIPDEEIYQAEEARLRRHL